MMGIGFPELMIILVIIMIIFGAGKLPEIGSAFGNSIRNFKKSMKEAEEMKDGEDATPELEEGETAEAPAEDSEAPDEEEAPVASESEPKDK